MSQAPTTVKAIDATTPKVASPSQADMDTAVKTNPLNSEKAKASRHAVRGMTRGQGLRYE